MTTSINSLDLDCRKRVRRGESFGRVGPDRTISNSLKCPSRQKKRNNETKLGVRFAEETPMIYLCSHFEKGMTEGEKDERKKELWYSREDFEEFLKDRISTIRLLKAVKGDASVLREHCPDLCLRGLEPYQEDALNQHLQCQRQMHQRIVLAEQAMQKSQKQCNPESIRRLAEGRSEWARKRAHQLATMDEMELKGATRTDSVLRHRSLASAQLGLQNLMLGQRQQRRGSISHLGLSAPRRLPVDVAILKEWNAKFLQDIRHKNGGITPGINPASLGTTAASAPSAVATTTCSLSDKTAESRRALQSTLSGSRLPSSNCTLGYGELLANRSSGKDITAPSFRFPLRRDSLVGLRRESFLAAKAAATPAPAPSPSSAMSTLAAAAAAVSAAGGSIEAHFRFPLRRDSLGNVH